MIPFWAKTTPDDSPGISVYQHMIDVGCVAQSLAEITPATLTRFDLLSIEIGALAALHDIGKISPGFQQKCIAWLEENGLLDIARNGCWDTGTELDHGKVSHVAIQSFLTEKEFSRKTVAFVSAALAAHHGRIKFLPNGRDIAYPLINPVAESVSQIDWDAERLTNAQKIWDYFTVCRNTLVLDEDSPALWWLAGLTTVADWIGSNEAYFPTEQRQENEDVHATAHKALTAIGFQKTEFNPNLSFHDLFHDKEKPEITWVPNEMQEKTLAAVNGPGVYVFEAQMGMGKTEAALWATYKLLISGKAQGIYFALPTQATSNRIHLRLNDFLRRIAPEAGGGRLIHGNSWLMEQDISLIPTATDINTQAADDARTGQNWFASTKRALLAPFGVGTVDQALLGVVAAKHFFVRHFALAGKVVILDEIHSYDLYTGTLINKLITTLEALGCTVIVLSATLTKKRLNEINPLPDSGHNYKPSYPLISGRKEGRVFEPIPVTVSKSKKVVIDFKSGAEATEEAIEIAQNGGVVLWVCNTVDAAQKQYQTLVKRSENHFPIGLLHSRYPFWRREKLESEWMERLGKSSDKRCGSILVSTQIVEQSVDLDADLMVTEIAPTDMLLQRLGRLWRHERKQDERPVKAARLYIIKEEKSLDEFRNMEPKAIKKALGSKAYVYAPYILLRSLEVWEGRSEVLIPSQIRSLLEETYKDQKGEPESWEELSFEWLGTDSAKKMLASRSCNLWEVALDDDEGVQTRINEVPTASLILCHSVNQQKAVFIDNASEQLGREDFRLSTAQAIHKNLIKVPEYCFEKITPCSVFSNYLYGLQCVGIVMKNGSIDVPGLNDGTQFFYSDELGLEIKKDL